jgi:hypothetical protein
MEKQKLPNAVISLILAILSLIGCCCTSGFGGVILSGIALFLTNKDEKKYAENPDLYDNFGQVKTAKIIAIISLVLSLIIVGTFIYLKSTGQYDEMMQEYMKMVEEMQQNQ